MWTSSRGAEAVVARTEFSGAASSLQQHGFVAGVEDVPDFFDLRSAELAGARIGRAELKERRISVVNQEAAKIFPGMGAQSVVEGAAENRRKHISELQA